MGRNRSGRHLGLTDKASVGGEASKIMNWEGTI